MVGLETRSPQSSPIVPKSKEHIRDTCQIRTCLCRAPIFNGKFITMHISTATTVVIATYITFGTSVTIYYRTAVHQRTAPEWGP